MMNGCGAMDTEKNEDYSKNVYIIYTKPYISICIYKVNKNLLKIAKFSKILVAMTFETKNIKIGRKSNHNGSFIHSVQCTYIYIYIYMYVYVYIYTCKDCRRIKQKMISLINSIHLIRPLLVLCWDLNMDEEWFTGPWTVLNPRANDENMETNIWYYP